LTRTGGNGLDQKSLIEVSTIKARTNVSEGRLRHKKQKKKKKKNVAGRQTFRMGTVAETRAAPERATWTRDTPGKTLVGEI